MHKTAREQWDNNLRRSNNCDGDPPINYCLPIKAGIMDCLVNLLTGCNWEIKIQSWVLTGKA